MICSRLVLTLILLLLMAVPFSEAGVRVTNGRISLGGSMRTQSDSWMLFNCRVENTDDVPRSVTMRVTLGSSSSSVPSGVYSSDFVAPPRSRTNCRIPFMTSSAQEYDLKVFVDGKSLATGQANPALISPVGPRRRFFAVMNDSDDSPGAFVQLPAFKDKVFTNTFYAGVVPLDAAYYSQFDGIAFYKPDFTKYSAAAFDAILQYIANGGTCVFLSPEGVVEAEKTPLSVVLPVVTNGFVRADDVPEFRYLAPGFKGFGSDGCDFLSMTPKARCAVLLSHDSMPLAAVRNYGLGTVRVSAVDLSERNFNGSRDVYSVLMEYILSTQRLAADPGSFVPVLDSMTGFSIPAKDTVAGLMLIYSGFILLIVLSFFMMKKAGAAWAFSGAFAVVAFVSVLFYASFRFSDRSTVLARIRMDNLADGGETSYYCAYFAETSETLSAGAALDGAFFSRLGTTFHLRDIFGGEIKKVYEPAFVDFGDGLRKMVPETIQPGPVEFRTASDGAMKIESLSIRPRTSEQFMYSVSRASTPSVHVSAPVVALSGDGMSFPAYDMPVGLLPSESDGAFLVMPGGVRALERGGDGLYRLSSVDVMPDTQLRKVADAVRLSRRSSVPYLAFVVPAGATDFKSDSKYEVQGRDVIIIPCIVQCVSDTVLLPFDFTVPFSSDMTSNALVRGNEFVRDIVLEADGQTRSFPFSLPHQFNGAFAPSKLILDLDASFPRRVSVSVVLRLPGGGSMAPVSRNGNIFEFASFPVAPDGVYTFDMRADSVGSPHGQEASEDALLTRPSWRLRSMRLSCEGVLRTPSPLEF